MNEQTEQLVSLQVIDLEIDQIDSEIKKEQEELDKRISALAERESRINELDSSIETFERERRTLEDEMTDKIAHVKERQSKMMQVQTSREQTALLKEIEDAKKNLVRIPIINQTLPHEQKGKYGGARVFLRPASHGTGVIAGGGVRAVVEAAGYKDILSKSLGSQNVLNVMMATMDGLRRLKRVQDIASDRDKDVAEVSPFWSRN